SERLVPPVVVEVLEPGHTAVRPSGDHGVEVPGRVPAHGRGAVLVRGDERGATTGPDRGDAGDDVRHLRDEVVQLTGERAGAAAGRETDPAVVDDHEIVVEAGREGRPV